MSNKNKQKVYMKSIREYEKAQRAQLPQKEDSIELMPFDQWWADNSSSLKMAQHMKEIVRADFRGRDIHGLNTKEKWDWAARQFGIDI